MDINYFDIEFDHSVNFERDKLIVAVAHERESGRIRVFRIDDTSGDVRALARDQWARIGECESACVINKLTEAWYRRIPTYTIQG